MRCPACNNEVNPVCSNHDCVCRNVPPITWLEIDEDGNETCQHCGHVDSVDGWFMIEGRYRDGAGMVVMRNGVWGKKEVACEVGEVGPVLREMREEARLTQIEVAHLINRYTGSTISHYERGLRDIALRKLEEVTRVLGWDVEIVMRRRAPPAVNVVMVKWRDKERKKMGDKEINNLSDMKKSRLLSRLVLGEYPKDRCPVCGWHLKDNPSEGCVVNNCSTRPTPEKRADEPCNYYHPSNMSQAWQVMNWAVKNLNIPNHHFQLREMVNDISFFTQPPSEAQRVWLDKILALTIEAGMIQDV